MVKYLGVMSARVKTNPIARGGRPHSHLAPMIPLHSSKGNQDTSDVEGIVRFWRVKMS